MILVKLENKVQLRRMTDHLVSLEYVDDLPLRLDIKKYPYMWIGYNGKLSMVSQAYDSDAMYTEEDILEWSILYQNRTTDKEAITPKPISNGVNKLEIYIETMAAVFITLGVVLLVIVIVLIMYNGLGCID